MSAAIRAVILGHWGGNIGHEVMAIGVEELVNQAFPGCAVRKIEQHRPLDIYPQGHFLRGLGFLGHGRGGAWAAPLKNLLNTDFAHRKFWPQADISPDDVAVACGGPLVTPRMSESDLGLMYQHLHGAYKARGRAMMNLSVGSCFAYEAASPSLSPVETEFLRRVFRLSTATTVRDRVALEVCRSVGESPALVPDTGFLAGHFFRRSADFSAPPKIVAINYQARGANEDWGQGIDPGKWANTLKALIKSLQSRNSVVFVCHDKTESALAERLDPTVRRFEPKTAEEYASFAPQVKVAVCNRLHAAIALAGTGVPVIGVGTDSRLKTLEQVGLPTLYAKTVTAAELEAKVEELAGRFDAERARLLDVHAATMRTYVDLLRTTAAERRPQ